MWPLCSQDWRAQALHSRDPWTRSVSLCGWWAWQRRKRSSTSFMVSCAPRSMLCVQSWSARCTYFNEFCLKKAEATFDQCRRVWTQVEHNTQANCICRQWKLLREACESYELLACLTFVRKDMFCMCCVGLVPPKLYNMVCVLHKKGSMTGHITR